MNTTSLGILTLRPPAVAAGSPLLCLSAHQYLVVSRADLRGMRQKRSVLTQEAEDGRTRTAVFSLFLSSCVILNQTCLCFILQLLFLFCRRCVEVYLKSTIGFVKLSFSRTEILKFHFIHSLLPLLQAEFLTAKLFLYLVSLYKHLAFLLARISRNTVNVLYPLEGWWKSWRSQSSFSLKTEHLTSQALYLLD